MNALRLRQAKNHMAILLLSRGVPMLLAGDEVLRTQRGNNNAYCQDNAGLVVRLDLTDWQCDMLRFTREAIALRQRHPSLTLNRFFTGTPVPGRGLPDITWHGVRLDEPPWGDGQARLLRFTIAAVTGDEDDLHVVFNMSEAAVDVSLPDVPGRRWHVALDTSLASPFDIVEPGWQAPWPLAPYPVGPRTVVVLEGRVV